MFSPDNFQRVLMGFLPTGDFEVGEGNTTARGTRALQFGGERGCNRGYNGGE